MDRRESASVRITDARTSHTDDLRHRQRRYLTSMGIRVVCFVGAVIVDSWLRWVLIVAAVFLPYIAVVMANAVSRRPPKQADSLAPDARGSLESGASHNVDRQEPS